MDSEKEKTLPAADDNGDKNAQNDDPHHPNNHHDKNEEPSKDHPVDNPPPSPPPPTDDNAKEPKPDIVEKMPSVKIQDQEPPTEKPETEPPTDPQLEPQPEPEPSPLPPDLGQVSQEIDEYISTLSNFKPDESTPPDVPISVEQFSVLIEAKIDDYDSSESPVKWSQLTDDDASSLLEAVDRMTKLFTAICEFSSEHKYAYSINRVGGVLQRAMSYLEEEFRSLLEDRKAPDVDQNNNDSKSKHPAPSGSNQDGDQSSVTEPDPLEENNFPGYPEETVSNLNRIVKALIVGGHETECCQVYLIARRNALEESLRELGFEKHSIDDVQKMNWESLETEIASWNKTFKQCATVHFSIERKLSDAVFEDYPAISEGLFSNLSRGIIIQFLNFAESVAMTKRAAEKLFKFLDIYEALRDLPPKVEDICASECVHELKSEASLTRGRLGEAIISIFCELENSIQADAGKTPVAGGAVHPLTRYILNYLKYACEYKDTLDQVFREHQKIERAESAARSDFDCNSQGQNQNSDTTKEQTPFQRQLIKVMDLLDSNLDAKSKLYRDVSLSMIFLMNNGRYIVQKIRGSPEINSLLGDTWCRKRSSDLRQYHKNYQRETWNKVLNILINHEGLIVQGKVVKPVLKERFKSFNAMFDEILKTQSCWVISDEQLQSELRVSISNMVVPAYRSFMARFSQNLTPGRQTEKYVKYQPEDVEAHIDELFDGSAGNAAPAGRWRM